MRVTKVMLQNRLHRFMALTSVECNLDYYRISGGYRVETPGFSSPFGLARVPAREMLDHLNIAIQTIEFAEQVWDDRVRKPRVYGRLSL